MKTQISYTKADGSNGLALVDGAVDEVLEAKRELAAALNLPFVELADGEHEDVDTRLRDGGVDPSSVTTVPVAE